MRALRPFLEAAVALGLLVGFFTLDDLHIHVLRSIWPQYADELPFEGGNMLELGLRTVELVLISTTFCIAIGLPLGILATRPSFREEFAPLANALANAGQTIPSLAIVALALPLLGLGMIPAIVAMVVHGILPILRNTVAALESVNPAQLDAGRGMGMTGGQLLLLVEMPHAFPVILAGIRTSAVLNVGVAVLSGLIGAGGLGAAIVHGLDLQVSPLVWYGAVPTALLAVTLDFFLGRLEQVLVPAGLRLKGAA